MKKKCVICKEAKEDLDFLERCELCFRLHVMNVKDSSFGLGKTKAGHKVTAAHYDDIVRRRIGSDGKVYRDNGRKSITI